MAAILLATLGATARAAGSGSSPPSAGPLDLVVARDLPVKPPARLAMDASGNTYVVGGLSIGGGANFQTRAPPAPAIDLQGEEDIFVARYDKSGHVVWARTIAADDAGSAPGEHVSARLASGVAVARDGTLAIIGSSNGQVTFGKDTVSSATSTSFLAAVSSATGERLWARQVNMGSYGSLRSVAANPRSAGNRIAVCGWATRAAREFVDEAAHGGLSDALVAAFDTSGKRIWSAQLGGKDTEGCNAVAVDDAGDVYASGWFDGESITFPGSPPLKVAGPGDATRKFLWVAKFAGGGDGAGGARTIAAAAFSGSFGSASPSALAVTGDGGIVLAGQFTGRLVIGAEMASAGQDDGFVAKLDGKTLAQAWNAVRIGGEGMDQAKGVGVLASGDMLAIGTFGASAPQFRQAHGGKDTDGAAQLSTVGSTATFLLRISGKTGKTIESRAFGGEGTQAGEAIVAPRSGGGPVVLLTALSGAATFDAAGTMKAQSPLDTVLVFGRVR
jgi:hypothetical protein